MRSCADMFSTLRDVGIVGIIKRVHLRNWHMLGQVIMDEAMRRGQPAQEIALRLEAIASPARTLVSSEANGIYTVPVVRRGHHEPQSTRLDPGAV